ncbi:hypothetical protein BDZ89DRAFT_1078126 [Hymenopellis radicata]|nr:hypothetical protein BDZ89DRAFT_1078126 [Hymenopellis radicata]
MQLVLIVKISLIFAGLVYTTPAHVQDGIIASVNQVSLGPYWPISVMLTVST